MAYSRPCASTVTCSCWICCCPTLLQCRCIPNGRSCGAVAVAATAPAAYHFFCYCCSRSCSCRCRWCRCRRRPCCCRYGRDCCRGSAAATVLLPLPPRARTAAADLSFVPIMADEDVPPVCAPSPPPDPPAAANPPLPPPPRHRGRHARRRVGEPRPPRGGGGQAADAGPAARPVPRRVGAHRSCQGADTPQ